MEETKLEELVKKLENGTMGCGVIKADKSQCNEAVEDLVVVGDTEKGVLPVCLKHSEGLEEGKPYLVRALNGKDYAIQWKKPEPPATIISVDQPERA